MDNEIAVITVEPAVKYSFVFKSMQTRLMGQYNARLACVHPPPPLKKLLSRRFFLEGGDDRCDTGYARLTLSPRLHVKPLQCQIDSFASFAFQTADICNNSYCLCTEIDAHKKSLSPCRLVKYSSVKAPTKWQVYK